jgi:spore germination protein GerM
VAALKDTTKNKSRKTGGWFLFWLAFIIGIILLFVLNLERIQDTVKETRLLEHLLNRERSGEVPPEPPDGGSGLTMEEPEDAGNAVGPVDKTTADGGRTNGTADTGTGQGSTPAAPKTGSGKETGSPVAQTPAVKQVERAVYFIRLDGDGTILRTRAARSLAVSDTPMVDVLGSLIQGPTPEEERRGLISLIPRGTRVLNASIRGGTAYISFNEDFQFNTYGVEGYAAQLRQIVWTVTEFSNVKDVQFLIEGKRVDFLGEGIPIGSPLGRESF